MRKVVLVIHNVRSALNVGSMLRTAEGLGVEQVYLTGYTPYPEAKKDERMPHQSKKIATQIHKTALGAEFFINWEHEEDIMSCLEQLSSRGYRLLALEQTNDAISLDQLKEVGHVALIVGNELTGIDSNLLKAIKSHVQIPMQGRKESFNVAIAAAIALYHLRWTG